LNKLNLVKFADGGKILGYSQFLLLAQQPLKMTIAFKSGQK